MYKEWREYMDQIEGKDILTCYMESVYTGNSQQICISQKVIFKVGRIFKYWPS